MHRFYLRAAIIAGLGLTLGGCLRLGANQSKIPPDAGVYVTQSKGERWEPRHRIVVPNGLSSLTGVSVQQVWSDAQDPATFYLSTPGNGLLYTFDAGVTWQQAKDITAGTVNAVSVDPRNTCNVYVAIGNLALRSTDCNRHFREIYVDPRPNAVTAIAVDGANSSVIYLGTSAGEFLRSNNAGGSWSRVYQFGAGVRWMRFNPNEAKQVFVYTGENGFLRSVDGAQTWQSLNNGLAPFSGGLEIYSLQFVNDTPNTVWLLNRYGLLKSSDGGISWEALALITPPLAARIYAFAVNPNNSREIYYSTGSTFYVSADGGINWVTRRLPGRRAVPQVMFIHPRDPTTLYLGLTITSGR